MERYFNITGCCNPQEHYMVNLDSRLARIKDMVDKGSTSVSIEDGSMGKLHFWMHCKAICEMTIQ